MRGRYHSVQRAGAILCKDYGEVRGPLASKSRWSPPDIESKPCDVH